jgi:glutamate N-acetyltransferase/amino-acid N-acetyltransferase
MANNSKRWIEIEGSVTTPAGYRASAVCARIKPGSKRKDLALLVSDRPAVGAGLFTQNRVVAAPITVSERHLKGSAGKVQAIVVNSGNANACTGARGMKGAEKMTEEISRRLQLIPEATLIASTGVIGKSLPWSRINRAFPKLLSGLSHDGGESFSDAILTTDTCRKLSILRSKLGGQTVTVAGTAKGSGMIHPRMATMLAFITTDVAITAHLLREVLSESVAVSFNRISVDGDTSTNDSIFILANGASGCRKIIRRDTAFEHFKEGLLQVCISLARQIARDGEGAKKLITLEVRGSRTIAEAEQVARAIANSPLVKTALAGADANWGRIICAAGYSGASIDPSQVDIALNGLKVCRHGQATRFDEVLAKRLLERPDIRVDVNLHRGRASTTFWTCDLTEEYIRINASYRT